MEVVEDQTQVVVEAAVQLRVEVTEAMVVVELLFYKYQYQQPNQPLVEVTIHTQLILHIQIMLFGVHQR
jgi:hypothetical protein